MNTTDRKDARVITIGKTISRTRPVGPCPATCADTEPGQHAHKIGTSEYSNEVFVKVDPDGPAPLVDVICHEGPDLTGLTAVQAFAVAGLLVDGDHADGRLVSLLFDAHDLITRPEPRPRFGALRAVFRKRRAAEVAA